ncbi:MAG: response regulator [Chloroflexi bacterium]|nr:response regulator [Chloroflexota bacterium]
MEEKRNVLIVEDDPSWQRRFTRYLRNEPFAISIVATYQDALALIESQTFDLVILDINLTGVVENYDGLRLGSKLWSRDKNVKIIIVSGSDAVVKRLTSLTFAPNFILKKQNLDQDEFIEKVHLALSQKSLRD